MAGTWIDWTIVVVGCVLLLPRLVAHVLNTSLVRWLQSAAERHGLALTLQLGSLSLRQLCDVRVTAGRWRLPQQPALYASVELDIESIGFHLFKRKPITATVQGVRVLVRLEDETPADRERDRLAAAAVASPPTARLPSAGGAAAAAGASAPASATVAGTPVTFCRAAEISSRSLAEAANSLERSVVDVTSTAADSSTRISRLESVGRWLVLKLVQWLGVSLQRVEVCVRKGDVQAGVELGFNVWCGDTGAHSPDTSRQIHLDLLGLAVRVERVGAQTTFRKAEEYKADDPLWRMPPLLQILPTDIAIDMQMQHCIPVAMEGIDVQCGGIEVTADPALQLRTLEGAATEFHEQIKSIALAMSVSPPPTPTATGSSPSSRTHTRAPSTSASAPSGTASSAWPSAPSSLIALPSIAAQAQMQAQAQSDSLALEREELQRRQFALRFLPKQTKVHLSHVCVELLQRDERPNASQQAHQAASDAGVPRNRATGAMAMPSCPIPGMRSSSSSSSSSSISAPSIPPIEHSLLLRFSKVSILSSVKTAYPVVETGSSGGLGGAGRDPTVDMPLFGLAQPEDNSISSVDWSVNMVGPTIWMSQQGMKHPRLDVEYCKFTGHSSASFAHGHGHGHGHPHRHASHASGSTIHSPYSTSTPLQPSAGMHAETGGSGGGGGRRSRGHSGTMMGGSSRGASSSSSVGAVRSLFHPTSAYRPQTQHALTFVLVSLRTHLFPSSAEWAQYGFEMAARGQKLFESLPLPKPQPTSTSGPSNPASSGATRSAPSSAPTSVATSPESYLRQMISPGAAGAAGAPTPATMSSPPNITPFPQFPFASTHAHGASHSIGDATALGSSPSAMPQPSNGGNGGGGTSSSSSSSASSASLSSSAPLGVDDPYRVQSAVTITVKVVDLHVAIYPEAGDSLALCHLAFSEVSMRYDLKPPTLQHPLLSSAGIAQPAGGAAMGGAAGSAAGGGASRTPIASPDPSRPVWGPPMERIEVMVAGFVGGMPRELHNPQSLLPHPTESLRVPGRFFQLNSATLILDHGSPDLIFSAEGFTLRWSVQALLMAPPLVGLIIKHLPPSVTAPKKQGDAAAPAPAPVPEHTGPRFVKGTITNVAVDFPYLLEFRSDEVHYDSKQSAATTTTAHKARSADSGTATAGHGNVGSSILDQLSPPMRKSRLPRMPPAVVEEDTSAARSLASELEDVDAPATAASSSSSQRASKATKPDGSKAVGSGANATSSSSNVPAPQRTPSPPLSGSGSGSGSSSGSGAHPSQHRPTSLFSYKASIANLDVDILANAWSLLLYQSTCASEGDTFLTVLNASLAGNDPTLLRPKGMVVGADQVMGQWRPALQLGIFKIVKDCVSAAINFKYQLCLVVPAWRRYCWPDEERGGPGPRIESRDEVEARLSDAALDAARADLELDGLGGRAGGGGGGFNYDTDPMVAFLGAKASFVDKFRTWYRHIRARHLPEPFMFVSLAATNVLIDAALNRTETLGCVVRVQRFASRFVPHQFSFEGVEIDFMKKPIVVVREVHLTRVGLHPSLDPVATPDAPASASSSLAPPSPTTPHPLVSFTEEANLLANYLDLNLVCRDVRVEIAPTIDIGGVLDLIGLKVQALVKGIMELPTLDTLSRRTGGPGYAGCPAEPPPALLLTLTDFQFEVVDGPFESWLQQLHLLWLDERAEQERRRALLRVKLGVLRKEGVLDPVPASTSTSASGGGTAPSSREHRLSAIEASMYSSLSEWNSRSYHARVEALKASFRGSDSLKKAPLLNLTIASMVSAVGMEGEHGNFYEGDNVLRVVRARKTEEEQGWSEMARRRQREEEASHAQAGDEGAAAEYESGSSLRGGGSSREDSGLGGGGGGSNVFMLPMDSPLLGSSSSGPDIPDILLATPSASSCGSGGRSGSMQSSPEEVSPGSSGGAGGAHSGPRIGFLAGRYFKLSLVEIQVRLRNFPLPLFSCAEASMVGHAALIQITQETPPSTAVPMAMRDAAMNPQHHSEHEESKAIDSSPSGSPGSRHKRAVSEPVRSASAPGVGGGHTSGPGAGAGASASERAAVSIGGVHTVAVNTKYRPFQIFYDLEGGVRQANVAFSPCFLYTLRDVMDALDRVVPPLPELHPIQPIPGMIGLGSLGLATARKQKGSAAGAAAQSGAAAAAAAAEADRLRSSSPAQQEIEAVNYIHLFRGILHGRLALSVKDTEIKLLATNDPYESSKYLRIRAGMCKVSFEKSIFKLEVQQINALSLPARPGAPSLMELPQVELHTTVMWVCTEGPVTAPATNGSGGAGAGAGGPGGTGEQSLLSRASNNPMSPPMQTRVRTMSMLPLNVTTLLHSEHKQAQAQQQQQQQQQQQASDGGGPSALPDACAPSCPSECELQHVCNMHLSLSCHFSSHSPHPGPLAINLHSGSLATLVQFGQFYSSIPPLPFPRRTPLIRIDSNTDPSLVVKPLSDILRDQQQAAKEGRPPSRIHPVNSPVSSMDMSASDEFTPSPDAHAWAAGADGVTGAGGGGALDEVMEDIEMSDMDEEQQSVPPAHVAAFVDNGTPSSRRRALHSTSSSGVGGPTTTAPAWRPKAQRVELHGLYLERLLLEKLHLTIWEGADLGPARGLRLAIEHIYLAVELQEEEGLLAHQQSEYANFKQNKFCFPFKKVNFEQTPEPLLGAAAVPRPLVASQRRGGDTPPSSSGASGAGASGTAPATVTAPAPPMIMWSLSNLICGISKLQGLLVYNDRWREQSQAESESATKMAHFFSGSRVVTYTYENQRYTLGLGWSSRNLLPTDRPAWSNDTGSQKLVRDEVRLPSDDWEWEGDWHLDFQLRRTGEVDEEGWEYAHDFPRKYSRIRSWYRNVRRRRWIRVRKLKGQQSSAEAINLSVSPRSPSDSAAQSSPSNGDSGSSGGGEGELGASGDDSATDKSSRKRHLRFENADNFVLSLARVTCNQKQQQHSADLAMLILDRERSLFRIITAPIFSRSASATSSGAGPGRPRARSRDSNSATGGGRSHLHLQRITSAEMILRRMEADGAYPTAGALFAAGDELIALQAPSMSSQEKRARSLLSHFHIPRSYGARGDSDSPSVSVSMSASAGGVHNVHHLSEHEFLEAQLAQEELKRLHATTSSIVTVGAGLGMNPRHHEAHEGDEGAGTDDPDASEEEKEEEERRASQGKPNLRRNPSMDLGGRKQGVRFNKECVLDARRKKSLSAQGFTSLARTAPLTCHSLRLHDFKLLVTIEIRSTLVTLIDHYAATIMELMERQRQSPSRSKYSRRGRVLTAQGVEEPEEPSVGGWVGVGGAGAADDAVYSQHSMLDLLESGSFYCQQSLSPSERDAGDIEPPPFSPSPTPLSPPSTMDEAEGDGGGGGGGGGSSSVLGSSHHLRGTTSGSGTMEDLLRDRSDEANDAHTMDAASALSPRQLRKRAEALPARGSSASTSSSSAVGGVGSVSVADASAAAPPDEVHELFMLEVINPQIIVHSEETRGRILFMTQKVSLHGRVHFKSVREQPPQPQPQPAPWSAVSPPIRAARTITVSSPPIQAPRSVFSPPSSSSQLPIVSPPSGSSASSSVAVWSSRCDKFTLNAMVDELRAFVSPTDVDVDAGLIWFSTGTAGIFKGIMQPASFMCSVSIRPDLPAFTTPPDPQDTVPTAKGNGVGGDKEADHKSKSPAASLSGNGGHEPAARSKAMVHMSHSADDLPPHPPSLDLHSLDIKVPELSFGLDSYQFALLLDVMKTMTNPLPIQAMTNISVAAVQAVATDDEYAAARQMDAICTLAELKTKAAHIKSQITALEWDMRHIEWILSGVSHLTNLNKAAATSSVLGGGGGGGAGSGIGLSADDSDSDMLEVQTELSESQLSSPSSFSRGRSLPASASSFNAWLSSTTSKLLHKSARETVLAEIGHRFNELLREHARMSGHYLNSLLAVRLREIETKPQAQLQNVGVSVMLNRLAFSLNKQEKAFLSLAVDGIQADLHLYDDASADFSAEILALGAKNSMQAYTNPANKEYAWANIVTPLAIQHLQEGERDDSPDGAGGNGGGGGGSGGLYAGGASSSHRFHNEGLISMHGVKREEADPSNPGQTRIVVQHLELNVHPLQVKITYDTLAALSEFFVQDQEKFNTHLPPTSGRDGEGEATAGAIKSKKKYAKLKRQFLPTGHILEHAGAKHNPAVGSSSGGGGGAKGAKGLLDSIKHSRVVSVAKDFYQTHAHTASSAGVGVGSGAGGGGGGSSSQTHSLEHDLYDGEPHSPSVTRGHAYSVSGVDDDHYPLSPTGAALLERSTHPEGPTGRRMSMSSSSAAATRDSIAIASAIAKRAEASSEKAAARARTFHLVYVRLGSTLVNVSYWGNKQNNIEDFQGLPIRFKQIVLQKKVWTAEKILNHLKKECLRNLLGQVSNTLGGFLSYKLGFRPANDLAAQQHMDQEKQQQLWANMQRRFNMNSAGGTVNAAQRAGLPTRRASTASSLPITLEDGGGGMADDMESSQMASGPSHNSASKGSDGGSGGGGSVGMVAVDDPSSSSLLSHLDDGSLTESDGDSSEQAVKSMLFGAKKTKSKKFVESMWAILPRNKDKDKEKDKEKDKAATLPRPSPSHSPPPPSLASHASNSSSSSSGSGSGSAHGKPSVPTGSSLAIHPPAAVPTLIPVPAPRLTPIGGSGPAQAAAPPAAAGAGAPPPIPTRPAPAVARAALASLANAESTAHASKQQQQQPQP